MIEAGVVAGRRMTSYGAIMTDLKNADANWVDEAAVTDDYLVTSRNPDDIPQLNAAMQRLFAARRAPVEAV